LFLFRLCFLLSHFIIFYITYVCYFSYFVYLFFHPSSPFLHPTVVFLSSFLAFSYYSDFLFLLPEGRPARIAPTKVQAPQLAAPSELPRPSHTLLKVRCPAEFYRRPNRRNVGFPAPEDLDLSIGPLVSLRPPFTMDLHPWLHPPSSFSPPSEFQTNRSLPPVFEQPCDCPKTRSAFLGFLPSSRHQLVASTTYPGFPARAHVPSSAFRTPSTVCSATSLAGLFHPAATSRVCPSGVCPSPRSRTGFPRPIHALLPFKRNHLRFDPRQQSRPSVTGPCSPRRVRCLHKTG